MQTPLEFRKFVAHVKESAKNPRRSSMISRTSDRVLFRISNMLNEPLERVVNAGAGAGDLERILLKQKKILPKGKAMAVEPSQELSALIPETVKGDKRVTVVNELLENAQGTIKQTFGDHLLAQQFYTSAPVSTFSEAQLKSFLGTAYDLLESDGEGLVYIYRDVSDRLRTVFPHVESWNVDGQMFPPVPYRFHRMRKRQPTNKMFDPALLNGHAHNGRPLKF